MTIKTLKKIGKTVACFLVALVAVTVIIPILATIASVVSGIVSPLAILCILFVLSSSEGREELVKPYNNKMPWFKRWHLLCLCPIVSAVCSTPVLFVLSLILHWHLAATIVFGIVVSLAIIAVAILLTVTLYTIIISPEEPEGEQKYLFEDTNYKDLTKHNDIAIIDNLLNNKSGYLKSLNTNENDANKNNSNYKPLSATKIKTEIKSNNENNIKRHNSFSKKDIKNSNFYNNFFQKDQNENENKGDSSCKSLPLVKTIKQNKTK